LISIVINNIQQLVAFFGDGLARAVLRFGGDAFRFGGDALRLAATVFFGELTIGYMIV
jgi:hypothetical protein